MVGAVATARGRGPVVLSKNSLSRGNPRVPGNFGGLNAAAPLDTSVWDGDKVSEKWQGLRSSSAPVRQQWGDGLLSTLGSNIVTGFYTFSLSTVLTTVLTNKMF